MSASVRGETVVVLDGYEFEGTLGYGAFARVLKGPGAVISVAHGNEAARRVIREGP